jgi:acyl-CoA reductase-like NAD-dependent aldehyde dehydrogenase
MTVEFKTWDKQFIAGEWRTGRSERQYTNRNPFDESELVTIRLASKEDVDEAYRSAAKAQVEWWDLNPYTRSAIMMKAADIAEKQREDLIEILTIETGSSHLKAETEVDMFIGDIRYYAAIPMNMIGEIRPSVIPGKENRVYRLPVGVVGVISPFNFPLFLSIRAIAPALAAGNGVVVKPDNKTMISGGLAIAKVFEQAGIPKGLLNVTVASSAEIGDIFVEHPLPKVISFTGSTEVGKHIGELCGRHLKRTALELGGNNVMLVLEDADVELAVSGAVFGKFLHQGQICMSLNRIIVHRKLYDEFVTKFAEKVQKLKVGNPADKEVFIGPLIAHSEVERLQKLIDESISQGARAVKRGSVHGNVMEPVILADVTNDMAIAQTEAFGPVAAILPVDSEEDAIRWANESEYGLSGSVYTRNLEHGVEVALQIETGMVHVNDQSVNAEPSMPFGGEKASGVGRYGGEWSLDEFTSVRWVSVQKQPRIFPF